MECICDLLLIVYVFIRLKIKYFITISYVDSNKWHNVMKYIVFVCKFEKSLSGGTDIRIHSNTTLLKLIIYFIWSSLKYICVKIIWNRKVFETYKIMNKSCSSIGLYVFRSRMWVLFMEGEKGAPPPTLKSKYPKWVLVPGLYFNSIRCLVLNLLVLNLGELVMRTGKIVC